MEVDIGLNYVVEHSLSVNSFSIMLRPVLPCVRQGRPLQFLADSRALWVQERPRYP